MDFMIKMMRLVLFLLATWLMISCGEKEVEPSIKGHWYYCDKNTGYTELLIGDSTIDQMSDDVFGMIPVDILVHENRVTVKYDSTRFIELYTNNKAISYSNGELKDTLYRLGKEVATFYDYDCSLGMTPRDYRTILRYEYLRRASKFIKQCPTLLHTELVTKSLGTLDLDLLERESGLDSTPIVLFREHVQILNGVDIMEPELRSIEFSEDSTKVLITLDVKENILSDFGIDVHQDSVQILQISSYFNNQFCTEIKPIRLSVLVEFRGKPNFKAIGYNGEILQ
jgi:hypothetical protein